jgi:Initiator Replication protein
MGQTIDQRKNSDGFPKAGELIEFRSQQELTLQDRRILNLMIEHAGPHIATTRTHRIALLTLRGSHKGGERVRDSINRLMRTIVEVPTRDSKGQLATQRGVFLSDSTTTDDESNPDGEVAYAFSETMRQVIQRSQYWGRLKAYVICSFQSKYALALYEALCLRGNLQVSEQELGVGDFRDLLNVPEGKLLRTPDFLRRVVEPAMEEVNALSDFQVDITPLREGGQLRGQLKGFRLSWRRKEPAEWQACLDELLRPKVGRKARIKGCVDTVRPSTYSAALLRL